MLRMIENILMNIGRICVVFFCRSAATTLYRCFFLSQQCSRHSNNVQFVPAACGRLSDNVQMLVAAMQQTFDQCTICSCSLQQTFRQCTNGCCSSAAVIRTMYKCLSQRCSCHSNKIQHAKIIIQ